MSVGFGFIGVFLYWCGDDAASKVCNVINYANKSINLATWLGWLIGVSIWIFGCHDQGMLAWKYALLSLRRPVTQQVIDDKRRLCRGFWFGF